MPIRRPLFASIAALLGAAVLASPTMAQTADPATTAAAAAAQSGAGGTLVTGNAPRVGGDIFPVSGIPAGSCLMNAPALGSGAKPEGLIDGSKWNSVRDINRARRLHKAQTMHVTNVNMSGKKITGLKANNTCFYNSDFTLVKGQGLIASGLGFVDTDLTGANLSGARIPYSLFRDVTLAEVNAERANISYSRLDGGWKGSMRNLNLDNTQLVGFRVECGVSEVDGCPMDRQGLKLRNANLTRASFYPFYFPDVDATGAILDQTEVGLEHLTRFKGANIIGTIIVRSRNSYAPFLPRELAMLGRAMLSGRTDEKASFDCSIAKTVVQRTICTSPNSELRRLDREVARIDKEIGSRRTGLSHDQWARAERNPCALEDEDQISNCLLRVYRERRDALAGQGGTPDWTAGKQGKYALFISSDAPLTQEFLQSELFLRIRPVVLDSSQSRVMVRLNDDGTFDAKGAALGGCVLSAQGLTLDTANGWFKAGATPATRRRPASGGVPVLQGQGETLRVWSPDDGTYPAMTGVRCPQTSAFVPMQHVTVDQEALARLWTVFR